MPSSFFAVRSFGFLADFLCFFGSGLSDLGKAGGLKGDFDRLGDA